MSPGEKIQQLLHLIDCKYPAQLDRGLNARLKAAKLDDTANGDGEAKKNKKKKKKDKKQVTDGMEEEEEGQEEGARTSQDKVFSFVSLTFRGTRHHTVGDTHTT